jgi:hypothetical protein
MKKKATARQHFKSVHVETNIYSDNAKDIVKVVIGTFYHNEKICEFWVPRAAVITMTHRAGISQWVDPALIRNRAKHDFNITYDHYSGGSLKD